MKTPFLITLVACLFVSRTFAQISITIDAAKRLKVLNGKEAGINLNYLMDGGFTAPAALTVAALKNMGVKLLRYPGGEKSDNYLWSAAPWKAASPRMALKDTLNAWPSENGRFVDKTSPERLCKPVVLDFDELMPLCKRVGAEPLIVVAYDAMYNVKTADRPTKAQLITHAAEWVRYANITKKFGIKYWMIGNESWNLPDYNGRTTPEQYATDLYDFASAMKAVDPAIKIIANGKSGWWPTLLQSRAVSLIDVLAFSEYPVYDYTAGYEWYRKSNKNLTGETSAAIKAINTYAPEVDKKRLKVLVAEYNSIDWGGDWGDDNNLGHALCNFQIFGDLVVNPKVESACMWNTRWTTNETKEQHLFDAIDKAGKLNATGTAQQVWGQNLLHTMVKAASTDAQVKVYASYDTLTKNLNLFLLNKDTAAKTIAVSLANYIQSYSGGRYVFSGTSVNDKFPVFTRIDTIANAAALAQLRLAPASVTVLKLHAAPEVPAAVLSFTGNVIADDAHLSWQTQNDSSLLYYTVEKQGSGGFVSIGSVAVRGHETPLANYSFVDSAFKPGVPNQYRLKLVGRNEKISYSDTVKLETHSDINTLTVTLAPNPVATELRLQIRGSRAQEALLQMIDATGRIWGFEKVRLEAGTTTVTLRNLHGLQPGVYWLQVQVAGKRQTLPFLKR